MRSGEQQAKTVPGLFRSGLWSAAFAMVFLAIGGCFAFESPIDGDPGEGGFGSPTISRCRIMFRVTVETDVSWAESSMARTVNPLGSELDVFEIVQIDLGETGIEAS